VEKRFRKKLPTTQAHAVKRGTVSMLKKLGVSIEDVNLHVGWSLCSKTFEVYQRFVVVEKVDKLFFYDLI
jgi:hypothetical protein